MSWPASGRATSVTSAAGRKRDLPRGQAARRHGVGRGQARVRTETAAEGHDGKNERGLQIMAQLPASTPGEHTNRTPVPPRPSGDGGDPLRKEAQSERGNERLACDPRGAVISSSGIEPDAALCLTDLHERHLLSPVRPAGVWSLTASSHPRSGLFISGPRDRAEPIKSPQPAPSGFTARELVAHLEPQRRVPPDGFPCLEGLQAPSGILGATGQRDKRRRLGMVTRQTGGAVGGWPGWI